MEFTAKKAFGSGSRASTAGTWIRWTGQRILRTDFRCSAYRWGWSIGQRAAPDEDGELVAGVIYDPTRDELFVAEKGKGAWLNGRRVQVSQTDASG